MQRLTLPRLGPGRGDRQYPIATMLASGCNVAFASDWPISGYHPLAGLAAAVTRSATGRSADSFLPRERITLAEAITCYTRGPAYQAFEEDQWGRILVGARADLVHIGADLRVIPAGELAAAPVAATWLAGRSTHRST